MPKFPWASPFGESVHTVQEIEGSLRDWQGSEASGQAVLSPALECGCVSLLYRHSKSSLFWAMTLAGWAQADISACVG